ncbi:MAG TPA: hypothetical protein VME20_07195, partial [Acidimicrobiales bacterium]|nr:hypothetical protein [Acidimicrobiales bacterium]
MYKDHGNDQAGLIDSAWAEALVNEIRSAASPEDLAHFLADLKAAAEKEAVPESELLDLLDELWDHYTQVELPSTGRSSLDLVSSAWLSCTYRQARAVGTLTKEGLMD